MRPIEPGESLVYRFRAEHAGIYLYHCGTAPLLQHVANGMYGALVVDPPSLAPVDRELVVVQSELYLTGTLAQMRSAQPDLVVFNGYADQYRHEPVTADPGDRVRVWVLDAGPNGDSAFHVVGTQFDTVYKEGAYLLRRDDPERGAAQALDLGPGEGGFVETTIPAAGHYPMVTHRLADAGRGATGIIVAGHPPAGQGGH
jgi:nitrite reductase (NO-forming)